MKNNSFLNKRVKIISKHFTATAFRSSDVYIESQGWFIFGGLSDLETSQKLVGVDSKWEKGPDNIAKNIQGQCVVKVDSIRPKLSD